MRFARTDDNYIRTSDGEPFYFLDAREDEIKLDVIAHHLAQITRFTGATKEPYSVAQHSCLVADYLGRTQGNQAALVGLLHDASEAYLNDVSKPLKMQPFMAGYRMAEAKLQATIFRAFGLPTDHGPWLKEADELVYHAEVRDLLPGAHVLHRDLARDFPTIHPWLAHAAEEHFLQLFDRYSDATEVR